MRAAVTYGAQNVIVEEVPTPTPAKGQALIKIKYAGICGGDVRIFKGTFPYSVLPLINGHELSGCIEAIGEGVDTLSVGDRVVLDPILPCGECYACSIGKPNCCEHLKVTGVHVNGAFAQYIAAPAERIHKIPDSIPYDVGAMIEPYAIAMHSSNLVNIHEGDVVVILGAGPIGDALIDVAKSRGAKVIISEPQEKRLAYAAKFGPDVMVNPVKENLLEIVMSMTDNCGASVVMEATGVAAVVESTQDLVANGGRIGLVGVSGDDVTFHGLNFSKKELNIFGSRNSRNVFPGLIRLVAEGKLHPEKLITNVFDLEDAKKALETATFKAADVCKVLIRM